MKTILFIFAFLISPLVAAQCEIAGSDQIQTGERTTLRATISSPACDGCGQWSYDGQNVLLEGDTKQNEITIKGALPGTADIEYTAKAGDEAQKCTKTVHIKIPKTETVTNLKPCAIEINEFTVNGNGDDTATFRVASSPASYRFRWAATYSDGSQKLSSEPEPRFGFTNENLITTVRMQIIAGDCTRTISKTYDPYFWWFLK